MAGNPMNLSRPRPQASRAAPVVYLRPAGDAASDAVAVAEFESKMAAEHAASEEAGVTQPPGSSTPNWSSSMTDKRDVVRLETLFGLEYLRGLTEDEFASEAEWHRREDAGFPDDPPSEALYREHYSSAHPGVSVPSYPRPSVSPATPTPSPSGTGTPNPQAGLPREQADAQAAAASRAAFRRGLFYGALAGLATAAAVGVAVVVFKAPKVETPPDPEPATRRLPAAKRQNDE